MRTVKQSSVVRETENGEEGEEEGAEFGEEDLFHQQVGAPGGVCGRTLNAPSHSPPAGPPVPKVLGTVQASAPEGPTAVARDGGVPASWLLPIVGSQGSGRGPPGLGC